MAVSNANIASATQVMPHQQVFQITNQLMSEGLIQGEKAGNEWLFTWSGRRNDRDAGGLTLRNGPQLPVVLRSPNVPADFERAARSAMCSHFDTVLSTGAVSGVPKRFDFVSQDKKIVGDAKYYCLVNGTGLPPAKFSTIAEYVWLLEKTEAEHQFLIFGNDRRVPRMRLDKYGSLARTCQFFFLSAGGIPQLMHRGGAAEAKAGTDAIHLPSQGILP